MMLQGFRRRILAVAFHTPEVPAKHEISNEQNFSFRQVVFNRRMKESLQSNEAVMSTVWQMNITKSTTVEFYTG
jgi:hypothetical protein